MPSYANVPDETGASTVLGLSSNSVSDTAYEQALSSYNAGDANTALMRAYEAGNAGNVGAQLLAGHILKSGDAGAVNYTDAARWYTKAADQGNDDAMIELGKMAINMQGGLGQGQALDWFSKAAKLGRTDAMRALGDLYIKGVGVRADSGQGIQWMENAASQGDVLAARRMGDVKLDSDPKAALDYYETAARLGDPESAYFAAVMYAENLSIRPNETRAAALMKQAALAAHPAAMADYGLLVYQGRAGDGMPETAASWFAKAAHAGDDQGKFLYAYSLAKGDGVTQSFEDAYYWLLGANNSGVSEYDKDIDDLKQKLEGNVDPAILAKARARAAK